MFVASASLLVSSMGDAFVPPLPNHLSVRQMGQTSSIAAKTTRTRALFSTLPQKDSNKKELTPETIAELIEVSFIQSCLQLASGYVDVLKLFIVAVKAGYEANVSLSQLERLVEECPVNTANRELMKEEKELRREWMLVVYEMLRGLNGESVNSNDNNNDGVEARVSRVVASILDVCKQLESEEVQTGGRQDAKVTMASLSVSDTVKRSEVLTSMNASCNSPMEKALLMNAISVGVLTCKVLEEEKLCTDGSSSADVVARPPIPGTS
jgi:hypothetical protein